MSFWTFITGENPGGETGKTPEQLDNELAAAQELSRQRREDTLAMLEWEGQNVSGATERERIIQNQEQAHMDIQREQDRNIDSQIAGEFRAGVREGGQNITGALDGVFNIFGTGIGAVLKSRMLGIPIGVWLAVGVFLYFGGAALLRRKFIK